MKNIVFISMLITSSIYADLSTDQIRDMVKKIHDKREGISLDTLKYTKEPFVKLMEENNITTFAIPIEKKDTKLYLNAILNKSAYINGEWKGLDDNINGYVVKYIGKKGVVLRNDNQIKKLFLHKKRENFITIKKR